MVLMNPIWAADNANLADDVATLRADRDAWSINAGKWKANAGEWKENARAWAAHAEELEGRLSRIKRDFEALNEEAIESRAAALALDLAFKEATGKSFSDYFGERGAAHRVDLARLGVSLPHQDPGV